MCVYYSFLNLFSTLSTSDIDSATGEPRNSRSLYKLAIVVRTGALRALYYMVRVLPKQSLLTFWQSFLALEHNRTPFPGNTINIFTTLWQDPNSGNRTNACAVLATFFMTNRQFLVSMCNEHEEKGLKSKAKSQAKQSTMSLDVARRIRWTFDSLISVLQHEQSKIVKYECLNAITKLVQNVPFNKLKPGIITKLLNEVVLPCQPSESEAVTMENYKMVKQVIGLQSSILKIQPVTLELDEIIKTASEKYPWILQTALKYAKCKLNVFQVSSPVLLQTIGKHQPYLLRFHESKIWKQSCDLINSKSTTVDERLIYLELLESLMFSLNEQFNEKKQVGAIRNDLWEYAFSKGTISRALSNEKSISEACDVIATLKADTFDMLDKRTQMYSHSFLFSRPYLENVIYPVFVDRLRF